MPKARQGFGAAGTYPTHLLNRLARDRRVVRKSDVEGRHDRQVLREAGGLRRAVDGRNHLGYKGEERGHSHVSGRERATNGVKLTVDNGEGGGGDAAWERWSAVALTEAVAICGCTERRFGRAAAAAAASASTTNVEVRKRMAEERGDRETRAGKVGCSR